MAGRHLVVLVFGAMCARSSGSGDGAKVVCAPHTAEAVASTSDRLRGLGAIFSFCPTAGKFLRAHPEIATVSDHSYGCHTKLNSPTAAQFTCSISPSTTKRAKV